MPTLFFSYIINFKSMLTRFSKQNTKSPNQTTSRSTSVRGRGRTPVKKPSSNISTTPFQPRSSLTRTPEKAPKHTTPLNVESQNQSVLDSSNRNLLELSYTDLRFDSESIPDSIDCNFNTEMSSKDTLGPSHLPPSDGKNVSGQRPPVNISQTIRPQSAAAENFDQSQHPMGYQPQSTSFYTSGQTDINQIVDMLQRTITETQEEFRRELTSIKGTIDNICVTPNSPTHNSERVNVMSSEGNQNNTTQNGNNTTQNPPVHFKEWKVIFDGVGCVSDFLFKIDTLCLRNKCSHQQLLDNFHIFLSGRAETWYWFFIKQNPTANYPFLKFSITKEFGTLEKDHDVVIRMSLKKQGPRESYDEFHSAIVAMNSRLGNPMTDTQLIDILKKNLNPGLRYILFNSNHTNLEDFREAARKAEKLLWENKNQYPLLPSQRHVNEIKLDEGINKSDNDPQIEALQLKRKTDYSRILCWNCTSYGHSYIYCPEEKRNLFCFKCGEKGVTTPKCPNKHMENSKPSEFTIGDTRSGY